MTTDLMSFNKNSNIGLFAFVNNKFALVGKEVSEKNAKELKRVFEVPVHRISIAGTSLIGVFITGNDNYILVPGITFDTELRVLKELGIDYKVFRTDITCLGNNISLSKEGVLVNPEFSKEEIKEIEKLTGLPTKKLTISDTETPGSCIVINKKEALIHRDASNKEIEIIEKTHKIKATPSTINMGSPYIKSGILCNDKGLVIGETSGPAEIMTAEEILGFLD